ncbi:MAG: hypothetical protein IKY07_02745, partial [Clostridia bacterium]|nr:hypothetical protein [Clostridia bacterium]
KSVKDISTVITNFEVINKYLAQVSPGYNDFFLFDDYSYFVNYRIKVFEYLEDEKHYSSADRKYRIISNCLWYLDDYYRNKSFWDSNAKNPLPRAALEISPD